MASVNRPVHSKITLTYSPTVHSGEWLSRRYKTPKRPFSQAFSALIVRINCQNRVPLKHGFVYCRFIYATTGATCVGISTIRLRSIKSSLPSLYSLRHSSDKIFQALYRFSVLQATKFKSWAGSGNEATGNSRTPSGSRFP